MAAPGVADDKVTRVPHGTRVTLGEKVGADTLAITTAGPNVADEMLAIGAGMSTSITVPSASWKEEKTQRQRGHFITLTPPGGVDADTAVFPWKEHMAVRQSMWILCWHPVMDAVWSRSRTSRHTQHMSSDDIFFSVFFNFLMRKKKHPINFFVFICI